MHEWPRLFATGKRDRLPALWLVAVALCGCQMTRVNGFSGSGGGSATGAQSALTLSVSNFTPPPGGAPWTSMGVGVKDASGTQPAVTQQIAAAPLQKNGQATAVTVPTGSYVLAILFANATGNILYQQCGTASTQAYAITSTEFRATMPICALSSATVLGQVVITAGAISATPASQSPAASSTAIAPAAVGSATSTAATMTSIASSITGLLSSIFSSLPQSGSASQSSAPAATAGAAAATNIGSTPSGSLANAASISSYTGSGNCTPSNYGLPSGPAPGTTTQYPQSGSLSQLPALSASASVSDIKAFVATVYSTFPVFSQIYEGELGLSEPQALAFMFADMSRESAGGGGWQINLETGQGSSGHAWGPFQAAVTNFQGGGYDSSIEDYTGLPIPSMAQFEDPATSTYAGMKRLADGVLNSIRIFGAGQPAQSYLLGTLADHNTGWPQKSTDSGWQADYGFPVLTMMQGYLFQGSNLTSNYFVGNGESTSDMCK